MHRGGATNWAPGPRDPEITAPQYNQQAPRLFNALEHNPDYLLPGETVVVSITRKAPRETGAAYVLRINENGMINVPGTNLVAKIAGKKSEAAGKILEKLRQHHQGYADVMGMQVEVTRVDGSVQYPVLSSPPAPGAGRYQQPSPTRIDPRPAPTSNTSAIEKLRKELDKLRQQNENLKQQLETAEDEGDNVATE